MHTKDKTNLTFSGIIYHRDVDMILNKTKSNISLNNIHFCRENISNDFLNDRNHIQIIFIFIGHFIFVIKIIVKALL